MVFLKFFSPDKKFRRANLYSTKNGFNYFYDFFIDTDRYFQDLKPLK